MVSGMVAVRVGARVVVVGEDCVGVRPLRVTRCHVIGLLLKAGQRCQLQDLTEVIHSKRLSLPPSSYADGHLLLLLSAALWEIHVFVVEMLEEDHVRLLSRFKIVKFCYHGAKRRTLRN